MNRCEGTSQFDRRFLKECLRPDDTIVRRNRDNPIPMLQLTRFDISHSPNNIMTSCSTDTHHNSDAYSIASTTRTYRTS
jgi:hypothetical protein